MYNEEMKEAHRRRREMEAAQARQEGAPPDARLEALKAQCDRDMQRRLCFEAALLTPDVLSRALAFYRLMATWLQGLAGGKGDGEPLPVPPLALPLRAVAFFLSCLSWLAGSVSSSTPP